MSRHGKNFDRCQSAYDAMVPEDDDDYCDYCGVRYGDKHDEDCPWGDKEEEDHYHCPECKTVDGCSCDEQYSDYIDRQRNM